MKMSQIVPSWLRKNLKAHPILKKSICSQLRRNKHKRIKLGMKNVLSKKKRMSRVMKKLKEDVLLWELLKEKEIQVSMFLKLPIEFPTSLLLVTF